MGGSEEEEREGGKEERREEGREEGEEYSVGVTDRLADWVTGM